MSLHTFIPDSAFKQQRLPAWQPILTAGTVLPTFFAIGIAFIPIGIGILLFSDSVQEYKYDYTDCESVNGTTCADIIGDRSGPGVECECKPIDFRLEEAFDREVGLSRPPFPCASSRKMYNIVLTGFASLMTAVCYCTCLYNLLAMIHQTLPISGVHVLRADQLLPKPPPLRPL